MGTSSTGTDLPVVIVGAGFSGTLLAINLLSVGGRVTLIERDGAQLAKGLAFGTRRAEHLLNVRASNMSAFPDDPAHFLRWAGLTGKAASRFVLRSMYGRYLRELLLEAVAKAPGRADIVHGEAVDARFDEGSAELQLGDGTVIACSALVLALGNFAPPVIPVLSDFIDRSYFPDPWQPGVFDGLDPEADIALIGSGLTAVDVILAIEGTSFRGKITALSRRGLAPLSHAETRPPASPMPPPAERGSHLVRATRRRAAAIGWREAIDELRPHTQDLWRRHDIEAQDRFLRHLRPYWDVHRHRLAPAGAERIAKLLADDRLRFAAGKLTGADAESGGVRLRWRPRGSESEEALAVQRVIGCVGPSGDLSKAGEPLLQSLFGQGKVRPDAHRLGLDVDRKGRVRDAEGNAKDQLYAIGPLTKGEAWEIVAVPDIRRQVWDLARYLGNAHWVGGEGL